MRDVMLSALERLGADLAEERPAEDLFQMDEDAFRVFYDRTARPVWAYLSRMTGDPRLADDLLQEAYYRLLRARVVHESDAHRRNYLFRIATNLVHDLRRRPHVDDTPLGEAGAAEHADPRSADLAAAAARRVDLGRAMTRLKPRERDLLWLAYAQGSTHQEIADALGLKRSSIKLLLFRARRRLATLLRERTPGVVTDAGVAAARSAGALKGGTR
jgi:RNA polymerase sigma-70 factor (ECF subfamily)